MIVDTFLGHGIFRHELYLQVNNVDGSLGHFYFKLMNNFFIIVNKVAMTNAQTNEIKHMTTDPFIQAEAKVLY